MGAPSLDEEGGRGEDVGDGMTGEARTSSGGRGVSGWLRMGERGQSVRVVPEKV